jgi:nitroreductase
VTEASPRHSDYPIDKLFLDRWSPRAFTSEEISEHDLLTLLEAARWAPSAYNSQPWRFIYGRRGTPHFDKLLSFLVEFNQSWAKTASALVILVSNSTMLPPGKDAPVPSHSHSMDAGAAWASLALQALMSGWHTHGMVGFDMDEQAIAIGRKGDKSQLPEMLAGREMPSDRLPLSQIAMEGSFKA